MTPNPDLLRVKKLSKRQREVLDLLWFGLQDKEIADKLKITPRTVNAHVAAILKRLDVRGRVQAAVLWQRANLGR